MGAFRKCGCLASLCLCCVIWSTSAGQRTGRDAWSEAAAERQSFEAEPGGTHTRAEYTHVMDAFRAIYHGDPRDPHAARAAEQVAELLAEQGREFGDRKSLHDAAGQYLFVAQAYPGGSRAQEALQHADELSQAADGEELKKAGSTSGPLKAGSRASAASSDRLLRATRPSEVVDGPPAVSGDAVTAGPASATVRPSAGTLTQDTQTIPAKTDTPASERALVTGIRHWSTSSYTRVAIDLGGEVQYQAARVENPDRIFFDLHHAKLAPSLVGKSFAVTDDGFLTRVRAAQYSDEVTRVVLDVHEVAEYSAFLLPNPYRLIIDIHGKQGAAKEEARNEASPAAVKDSENPQQPTAKQPAAPAVRTPPAGVGSGSILPPMPVTDGSASFGLPAKTAAGAKAAEPRVVIPTKATSAKPVPNSVPLKSDATGTEVAAVSRQPGKVEATSKPTSAPIASKAREPRIGNRDQGTATTEQDSDVAAVAKLDHYRKPVHGSKVKTDPAPTEEEIAAGSRDGKQQSEKPGAPDTSATPAAMASTRSGNRGHMAGVPVTPPPPTATGETSLMRTLGLKIGRIVIDPGHGGHDSGTLGAGGIEEKDVVLDVALRLGKLLHDRLGSEIVYTRADDTFIPLETRTAIANKAQADLFISVHANSSQDASARGVEVYYLNFTSDPEAMRVAGRENAVSTQSVHELSDLVKKIALKDKIDESRELASDVDDSLYSGLQRGNEGLKNRGVKKAPFVVLIGANMPSILAEISFVTNPTDAEQLRRPEYRERVAESIYGGVARYAGAINGGKAKAGTSQRAAR